MVFVHTCVYKIVCGIGCNGVTMMVYQVLLVAQYVMAAIVFVALFKYVAAYGRYVDDKKGAATRFISYRRGWLIMEVPAVFTILIMYGAALALGKKLSIFALAFLIVWEIHYVYRTFIFPFLNRNKAHEFTLPVVIGGLVFNIINGFINGWALFFTPLLETVLSRMMYVYIGVAVFFVGFVVHVTSDKILRDVKRANKGGYGVPHGFLHSYVAAPNYFGEILQWFGFYIATASPAALAFALFTCGNLIPRAYRHRKWYRSNFTEYPQSRKIIIPFVW